ncbi:MAG: Zn-binding domain-containing protein, partial [Chloroflexota bacterium]
YPGSIASTWQQAGRSGRRGEESLSFLIGLDGPLDQYLMRHPEAFFGRSHEHALINPENPHLLRPHLLCAAWEQPLSAADGKLFGPPFDKAAKELEGEGLLKFRARRWHPSASLSYPAQDLGLRSASSLSYALVDANRGNEVLETIEAATAFFHVYPGAIYLHQGEAYLVRELNLLARIAYAVPTEAAYYTQTRDLTDLRILKVLREQETPRARVYLGEVEVTTTVVGFKKKRIYTEEVLGEEPLDLPPQSFPTVALWFDLPPGMEGRLASEGLDFAGGLHAAEHAAIGLLPLFALCDRNDIGGVSTPLHADTGRPQIFIHDAYPGGIGIAEKGFELVRELWEATLKAVRECPCQEGCPSCVQSPKCGNNNQPLDKKAAQRILEELLGERPLS